MKVAMTTIFSWGDDNVSTQQQATLIIRETLNRVTAQMGMGFNILPDTYVDLGKVEAANLVKGTSLVKES